MRYFDTSFLAPLFLRDRNSSAIEGFVAALPPDELATSQWARLEFSSLLGREVRMRSLTAEAATVLDRMFSDTVAQAFAMFPPAADDFDLAGRYIANYQTGLRAGDAMHLAIAVNRQVAAIYTLDNGLLKAGHILGLPVSPGIRRG
jgi:uncharacterized protein